MMHFIIFKSFSYFPIQSGSDSPSFLAKNEIYIEKVRSKISILLSLRLIVQLRSFSKN